MKNPAETGLLSMFGGCHKFMAAATCPLCNKLWVNASSFPCGCTFCEKCAIATLEGPGIHQSECPQCKHKYWKKDLKPNHTYRNILEQARQFLGYLTPVVEGLQPGADSVNLPPVGARGAGEEGPEGSADPEGEGLAAGVAEGQPPPPASDHDAPSPLAVEQPQQQAGLQQGGGVLDAAAGACVEPVALAAGDAAAADAAGEEQVASLGAGLRRSNPGGISCAFATVCATAVAEVWRDRLVIGSGREGAGAGAGALSAAAMGPLGEVDTNVPEGSRRPTKDVVMEDVWAEPWPRVPQQHEPRRPPQQPTRDSQQQQGGELGAVPGACPVGGSEELRGGSASRGTPGQMPQPPELQEAGGFAFPPPSTTGKATNGNSAAARGWRHHTAPAANGCGGGGSGAGAGMPWGTPAGGAAGRPGVHAGGATGLPGAGQQQLAGPVLGTGVATPHTNLLPPPRSQPCMVWPSAYQGRWQGSGGAGGGTSAAAAGGAATGGGGAAGGAGAGAARPGSVVSIRRTTPSVNNAYLHFHSLLEEGVDKMARQPDAVRATAHAAALAAGLPPDQALRAAAAAGGDWLAFDEEAWLRQLLALPGPTEGEREALEFEAGIVAMFLQELQEGIDALEERPLRLLQAPAAARAEAAAAAAAGAPVPRMEAAVPIERESPVLAAAPQADQRAQQHETGLKSGGAQAGVQADAGRLQAEAGAALEARSTGAGAAPAADMHCMQAEATAVAAAAAIAAIAAVPASPHGAHKASLAGPKLSLQRHDSLSLRSMQQPHDMPPKQLPQGQEEWQPQEQQQLQEPQERQLQERQLQQQQLQEQQQQPQEGEQERQPRQQKQGRPQEQGLPLEPEQGQPPQAADAAMAEEGSAADQPEGSTREGAVTAAAADKAPCPTREGGLQAAQHAAAAVTAPQLPPSPPPHIHASPSPGALAAAQQLRAAARECGPARAKRQRSSADESGEPAAGAPLVPPPDHMHDTTAAAIAPPGATGQTDAEAHQQLPRRSPHQPEQDASPPSKRKNAGGQGQHGGGAGRRQTQKKKRPRESQQPAAEPMEADTTGAAAGPAAAAAADAAVADATTVGCKTDRAKSAGHAAAAAAAEAPTAAAQQQQQQELVEAGCGGATAGGRSRRGPARTTHFVVGTGLGGDGGRLEELGQRNKAVEVLPDVAPNMTHLVVRLRSDRRAEQRTLKYLRAVLRGVWVVGVGWVDACLSAGRLVPEAPYAATGDLYQLGTPALTRGMRARGAPRALFAGVSFCTLHCKDMGSSNVAQLDALLQEAGATLVQRPPPRAATTAAVGGGGGGEAAAATSMAASLFGAAAGDDPYSVSSRGGSPDEEGSGGDESGGGRGAVGGGDVAAAVPLPAVVVLVVRERGGKDKDLSGLAARVARDWGCPLVLTTWVYDSISHYSLLPLTEAYVVHPPQQTPQLPPMAPHQHQEGAAQMTNSNITGST
ncbi:hypothetical protein HYH02_007602 [Chlamydomonas schloesseri]|uniref:RING-type E3 ubiquitin transferase BRCA1 n=1 Tax=Chlamydomonas schloesseri TaxID=2026947 RepID=A0A835WH22_9CHLO|nr:hypothetical protein HYH02_007602 [Chlamydomonas schloesseri]|eukprot:KAG2447272.1 hypothetical protein HYH02_007602 [Chlamydomonas schloesseri]